VELQEHDKLTAYARGYIDAEDARYVSVVSCVDPRAKGYALMVVTASGILWSHHIGPAAGAKAAIKRIAERWPC
jgi:hypothetical protein